MQNTILFNCSDGGQMGWNRRFAPSVPSNNGIILKKNSALQAMLNSQFGESSIGMPGKQALSFKMICDEG